MIESSANYGGWVSFYDHIVVSPDQTKVALTIPAKQAVDRQDRGYWFQVALVDLIVSDSGLILVVIMVSHCV